MPDRSPRPKIYKTQDEADRLMAEAAADAGLDPGASDRQNVVLLFQAAFFVTGSMGFPLGWVDAARRELHARGCRAPSGGILRWYRSRLVDDVTFFAGVPGVAPEFVSDLLEQASP